MHTQFLGVAAMVVVSTKRSFTIVAFVKKNVVREEEGSEMGPKKGRQREGIKREGTERERTDRVKNVESWVWR